MWLVFATTDGIIIDFEVVSKIEGHWIQYPNKVHISATTRDRLVGFLEKSPLMFDVCVGSLMRHIIVAARRADDRLKKISKVHDMLQTIGEVARTEDLAVQILLFDRLPCGMPGSQLHVDRFRQIARLDGTTPEARTQRLTAALVSLRREKLSEISQMNPEKTLKIIEDPDVVFDGSK